MPGKPPPAVKHVYSWYCKRSEPQLSSRAEMAAKWRVIRRTQRFELRRLLWRHNRMVYDGLSKFVEDMFYNAR